MRDQRHVVDEARGLRHTSAAGGAMRIISHGRSITDACLGWDESATLLQTLADAVAARRRLTLASHPELDAREFQSTMPMLLAA